MAKYYDCGTSLELINAALQDYYGAGVTIHSSSSTVLIFSCAAISDKVIKLTMTSSRLYAYYGDSYDSGAGDITNPVNFGGTYNSSSVSKAHVILGDTSLFINCLWGTINSKIVIVGQLSDGTFAVAGMAGNSIAPYCADCFAYRTAGQAGFTLLSNLPDAPTEAGKIFKVPLYIIQAGGVPVVGGVPVSFKGISACTRRLGSSTLFKGSGYFISTSGMYFDNAVSASANSLLIEDITN
jgi:hypothetical protein